MSGYPYNSNPYNGGQYAGNPAALGVRPAPELVQRLLVGAFGWMFAGLLVSAGVAYLVATSEKMLVGVAGLTLPLMIGAFILAVVIQMGINRMSATLGLLLFFVYAAMMGLVMGVIVWAYIRQPGGVGAVASAFVSASAMFGGAALYGKTTGRDLSGIGGIMTMALIGIIVASVINIFVGSGTISWIISLAGVGIFTVLTAWDVQKITSGRYAAWTTSAERASVVAALALYLDFINLFLFLLRLFGGGNRR